LFVFDIKREVLVNLKRFMLSWKLVDFNNSQLSLKRTKKETDLGRWKDVLVIGHLLYDSWKDIGPGLGGLGYILELPHTVLMSIGDSSSLTFYFFFFLIWTNEVCKACTFQLWAQMIVHYGLADLDEWHYSDVEDKCMICFQKWNEESFHLKLIFNFH
jgi:hypothetical protein